MKEIQYWLDHNLRNYQSKKLPITDFQVDHIIDWLKSDYAIRHRKRIARLSVPDAIKLSDLWTLKLNKKATINEKASDVEVLYVFDDGHKVVKLLTEHAYRREGKLMSHCVASYFDTESIILSLRDQKNNPICTIEIRDVIVQGRGFANSKLDKKYIKYIIEYFKNNYRDIFLNSSFAALNDLGLFDDIDYIKEHFIQLLLKLSYRELYSLGLFKNEECTELILFSDLKYKNWIYYEDVSLNNLFLKEVPPIRCLGMLDLSNNLITNLPEWVLGNRQVIYNNYKIILVTNLKKIHFDYYIRDINLSRNPIEKKFSCKGKILSNDRLNNPYSNLGFIISNQSIESLIDLYKVYKFVVTYNKSIVEAIFKNDFDIYLPIIKKNILLREWILSQINDDGLSLQFYYPPKSYKSCSYNSISQVLIEYFKGNASLSEFSEELRIKNKLISLKDMDMSCFKIIDDYIPEIESHIHSKGLSNYVIAGNAVSNIIYAEKNGFNPNIHEIEVFVRVPSSFKVLVLNNGASYFADEDFSEQDFIRNGTILVHSNIKILNKEYCGNIIYIYVEACDGLELEDLSVQALLYSFDFNCTKSAYKNGKIVVGDSFLYFLKKKGIVVRRTDDIIESCNRICRKLKELPGSSFSFDELILDNYSIWENRISLIPGNIDGILNLLNLNTLEFRNFLLKNYNGSSLISLYYSKGFLDVGCDYSDVVFSLKYPVKLRSRSSGLDGFSLKKYLSDGLKYFDKNRIIGLQYKCRFITSSFLSSYFDFNSYEEKFFKETLNNRGLIEDNGLISSSCQFWNDDVLMEFGSIDEDYLEYDLDDVSELMENAFDYEHDDSDVDSE